VLTDHLDDFGVSACSQLRLQQRIKHLPSQRCLHVIGAEGPLECPRGTTPPLAAAISVFFCHHVISTPPIATNPTINVTHA
jgi:hypothetical protein